MTAPAAAETPVSASPAGQKLTSQEVEQARLFLGQAQDAVTGATKGLTEAQWTFKPAPGKWSIAENLAHIVIVQERVLGPILDQIANAPPPASNIDCKVADAIVINNFPNRLMKFNAPEPVHPVNPIAPQEALIRFAENSVLLSHALEARTGLRQHAIEAPPMKAISQGAYQTMDGYQWILAAAAHTERHVKQMLEVMADRRYPA